MTNETRREAARRGAGGAGERWELRFAWTLIVVATTAALLAICRKPLIADEPVHASQIGMLATGDWRVHRDVTMVPGYHALIAGVGRLSGLTFTEIDPPVSGGSPANPIQTRGRPWLAGARAISCAASLLATIAFYLVARQVAAGHAAVSTLLFHFSPFVFPYFFVLYTDLLAVALVLFATWLVMTRRRAAAAAVVSLSLLVRQTNVVWVLFLVMVSYHRDVGLRLAAKEARAFAVRNVAFLAPICLFGAFAVWNRGVAIGDSAAHPTGVYLGNVFLLSAMVSVTLLPSIVASLARARGGASGLVALVAFTCAIGALFWSGFSNTHPYNQERFSFFLRNRLLVDAATIPAVKMVFGGLTVLGGVGLLVMRFPRPELSWVVPFGLLSVAPSFLVENRYALVSLAILLAARPAVHKRWDYLALAVHLAATTVVFGGIRDSDFFL